MKVRTISSGSKGNCAIVLCDETNLIIDMGISYLALQKSLEENSLSFDNFSGILITHNHKDHITGLKNLIKKTDLNVFIPREMYDSIKNSVPEDRCVFVDDEFTIFDVKIELIHTSHDAPYSVGFIISHDDKSLVYVTDTGYINRKFLNKMVNKDIYVIESNHDEVMLMDGPYPRFLKERVISDTGHLSNKTTAGYLKKIVTDNTKCVVLAHISEKNNKVDLAYQEANNVLKDKNIELLVAMQDEESKLIEV